MIHHNGKAWEPRKFAIAIGVDALRIAVGGRSVYFTVDEIVTWLKSAAKRKAAPKRNGE